MTVLTSKQTDTLFGTPSAPKEAPKVRNDTLFGTDIRGQALGLLGRGLSPSKVAQILEVSPALISQYKAEPTFAEELQQLLVDRSLAAQIRDEKLDALEDMAIQAVEESLEWITKPMEKLRALQVINGLKRRTAQEAVISDGPEKNTVVLELPSNVVTARVDVQFNTSREIVEVDGRAMRTMESTEVLSRLRNRQEERRLAHDGGGIEVPEKGVESRST